MPNNNRAPSDIPYRLGASLVMTILGALILWVGQETFTHHGQLVGANERMNAMTEQIRHLESELDRRTGNRFTKEDGHRLQNYVDDRTTKRDGELLRRDLQDLAKEVHMIKAK